VTVALGRFLHLWDGEPRAPQSGNIGSYFSRHSIIFDIGDHVSVDALASSEVAENGSVHAFEPVSVGRLAQEIPLGGLTRLQLCQCAVSDKARHTRPLQEDDSPESSPGSDNPSELSVVEDREICELDDHCE
jgi:hypothetical protein